MAASTWNQRIDIVICGWTREHAIEIPKEIANIFKLFACSMLHWFISETQFETAKKESLNNIEGPKITINNIKFQLNLIKQHVHYSYGGTMQYFNLCIDQSSLPKDILNLTVILEINDNCNIYPKKEPKQIKLYFNTAQNKFEEEIFSIKSSQCTKTLDIEFIFNIIDIEYHEMNIESWSIWNLDENELRKLNDMEPDIYHQSEDWMLVLLDNGVGIKGLSIIPMSLPPNVTELKVEYNLLIELKTDDDEDDDLRINGIKKFDKDMNMKRDFELFLTECYIECKISMKMTIVEIYCSNSDQQVLDRSAWSDYGFV